MRDSFNIEKREASKRVYTSLVQRVFYHAPLYFDAINLADTWNRWRQEVELFIDLAMCDRKESTRMKLFLYLVGN